MDGMGLLAAFWLISAALCVSIAANKGHSVIGWFLVGLVLGPLCVVILSLMESRKEYRSQASLREGRRSAVDELFNLQEMLERGDISEADFESAKRRLME